MVSKSISAVVGLGFLAMSSAQAATVSLTSDSSIVAPGGSFIVHVDASGFDTPTIGAALGVDYNPAVLRLDDATWTPGSPFEQDVFLQADDVQFYMISGEASGDFPVIDLHFTALTNDPTMVSLIDDVTTFRGWSDVIGDPIPGILYEAASVNVNPVPLPAAIWMMLSGLGVFGWIGRRRA